jgi:uncharacterized protein YggT (Ycf19 family)
MYGLYQVIQLLLRLIVYTYLGKGLLVLLAGANYRENPVWRMFDAITRPPWKLVRAVTPRLVPDAAIAPLTIFLLITINLGLYMLFYSQGWITPPPASPPG